MFLSREKFCYVFYDEKLGYVKERTKNVNAAMTANRIVVLLVFVSGIAVAVIGTLLSQYIRGLSDHNYHHVFIPLPSESVLNVYDEVHLDVALPRSQLEIENSATSTAEALTSLHLALEMKLLGKQKKAIKLFQHAVALAPCHPDILNHYGEFLEYTQNDVIKANEYYVRALSYQPNHEGALINSQRTARVVEELDRRMLRRIDEKRNALSAIPDNNAALIRAKKEAYFQHIYHTVGIEGNTMNLAQTRAIVETRTAVVGKSIDEHNEILGLDAAMKYINATLVNRVGSISIKDILEIHTRVLGHVDPVQGGQFRRTQVYVGGHIPPGPGDIHYLMEEFASWLNSERAIRMHPVRYAALAHYKLVHIHPFSDGNGRTSRLLMNMILMQAGYPPVIIHKQHRHTYYENLQIANTGDVRPFVRFIAECTEQTLDLFLWATSEFSRQVPALSQETLFTEKRNTVILEDDFRNGATNTFDTD
ncbi:adenosine monophosphate-protein transferase Fic [Apis mellifera caucasica]|uniref:Protein adenylyltransferase Fic n=1 Tax=Apis mellifera TaxID=7460 RepID=A0A7M7R6G8_APIME|nr:adenosine monophosphate-protein transferase Fic [Apis mellifera]KAG6804170.1 adenosine monophosphate-protein transferase Fic [Apis mellifera caucasica]KAG9433672.1 adenosine monophosphate-protein transferase Fic [Apis mellifera carnica]|eukprot:XP_393224.2 adenosine monophosphate-protein transferase Fic [Apis mellifera]